MSNPHALGLALGVLLLSPAALEAQRMTARPTTIVGLDYAYQAPATLAPGLTAITFENHGKVRHEVVLARLKPGATLDSVLHAETPLARLRAVQLIGLLIAEPGETSLGRLLAELTPGSYVLFCNFQDAPDKPRHLAMGMVASLEVRR